MTKPAQIILITAILWTAGCATPPLPQARSNVAGPAIDGRPPEPIERFEPDFPIRLRERNISGTVVVSFIVTYRGDVVDAKIVKSPHEELSTLALEAVRKWRFAPAIKHGRVVNARMMQKFRFEILDEALPTFEQIAKEGSFPIVIPAPEAITPEKYILVLNDLLAKSDAKVQARREGDSLPRIRKVAFPPGYPKTSGWRVPFYAVIDTTGRVREISGHAEVNQATVDTWRESLSKWQFDPATFRGQCINLAVIIQITL